MIRSRLIVGVLALGISACSMEPAYLRPDLPVPAGWPAGDAYLRQQEAALPGYRWQDVFADPRLRTVIGQALANNQNLAVAVANVEAARSQYRIQQAELLPSLDASASYRRAGEPGRLGAGGSGAGTDSYSVQGSVAGWEIDLFGRLRSLNGVAKDKYLASEAAARGTRLTLVSDVVDAWLSFGADASLLQTAKATADAARESLKLTKARFDGGIAPLTDVRQAEIVLATAEGDVANLTTVLAQDGNALRLLVGAEVDPTMLPQSIEDAAAGIGEVPAGLDSTILLRRPDVLASEWQLKAANGQIGAARAALFPRISLTGLFGFSSTALGSLFDSSSFGWQAGPTASYSIFSGGAGRAGVKLSQAQRDAALAGYRKSIQTAFADVANVLARQGTISAQLDAAHNADKAAADNLRLADLRYKGGIASYLQNLTARQSRYASARTLISVQLLRATNRVALYRALGGDSFQP